MPLGEGIPTNKGAKRGTPPKKTLFHRYCIWTVATHNYVVMLSPMYIHGSK